MLGVAGGIILGFLGLGLLGMFLSIDWRRPSPPPAPDVPWRQTDWWAYLPIAFLVLVILLDRLGAWVRP